MGGNNLYQYAPNPIHWIDPWGWCSQKLSGNMEQAGTPRPANSAAHHLVGDTSARANPARQILQSHGIGVDDAVNGVFLPNRNNTGGLSGILHNCRHPNAYIDKVNEIITTVNSSGGKPAVLDALDNIRNVLSSANKNADWSTVLNGII